MEEQRPYRLMLAISETASAEAWVMLALRLLPDGGEILLRGMITIPEGESLSEGAMPAQQLRARFERLTSIYPMIQPENWVRVNHDPFERILNDIEDDPIDLLLAEWRGPTTTTGGISTADILEHASCDLCLIAGEGWEADGPALLTLRGGPNLSLGMRIARALTPGETISLLHSVGGEDDDMTHLFQLLGAEEGISRVVMVRSHMDLRDTIIREASGHKLVVMGARLYQSFNSSLSSELAEQIYEQAGVPLVLIRAYEPEAIPFHKPHVLPRREVDLSTRVDRWFAENSFDGDEFDDLAGLVALKQAQGTSISVALPALNEGATVGEVIRSIQSHLMQAVPLIDEIVLIDSGSTDNTVSIARDCGIAVYAADEILPELGAVRGKGENLWKSLYVTSGDLIAWIDTDIVNMHPRFIYGIIGPLLKHPKIQYVKGFYHRPINIGGQLQAYGGGRVTELVARPLLNLFYPELSGVVQPLSGEYAGRRTALERVPFFSGYGVETGLLLDLLDLFGLDAIAQTNLQERVHHNQPLSNLSRMSFAILQVFMARLEARYGVDLLGHAHRSMKAIVQTPERLAMTVSEIGDLERPPMITIPAYRARYAHVPLA